MGVSNKLGSKVLCVVVAVVIAVGSFALGARAGRTDHETKPGISQDAFPLLARRITIDNPAVAVVNFTSLRQSIEKELEESGVRHSFYFEYLPTGTSIRSGDSNELVAASLMKVPIVMNLFRIAEKGEINMDAPIELKQEWLDDEYGTLYSKGAGYKLTLRDAARIALVESDNTALNAIVGTVDRSIPISEDVLNAIDVVVRSDQENKKVIIDARSYSSILKCLYFSCFLEKESSQEILEYLSMVVDDSRLAKYIPKDIQAAHKIGTYWKKIQSDCGIIYVPNRNYLLCIMIEPTGDDASEIIAQLSKQVYEHIEKLQ